MSAHRSAPVAVLAPVFSGKTWLAMVYLVSGLPLALVYFVAAVVGLFLGVGLLPLALAGLPVISYALRMSGRFWALEEGRAALMLGEGLPGPVGPPSGDSWWGRLRSVVRDARRWRQLAAALASLPLTVVCLVVAVSVWSLALALVVLPAYNHLLPHGGVTAFGWTLRGEPALAGAVALGAVLALVAPHATRAMASARFLSDRALLGSSRSRELAARVGHLEESRSRMVAAADNERRRIERDLHDGAQARLVSLAMELGRARTKFPDDPNAAKALVEQAHEEAKAALAELRSLVRGVHPPVLSDRGLDAALSGLAALCPVPVTVEVALAERPPPAVEAIAYFVVAEALTNVAKHSQASRASVTASSKGGVLWVAVRDNGRGGASALGAGLSGLADRARAVDGRFSVESPLGGPTVIEVELPCGS